jgi:hypothetical protein
MENAQEDGQALPKIKRGTWHQWARDMRAQGYTYAQIAEAVGVSSPAVYLALNPHKRSKPKKKGGDITSPPPSDPANT